MTVGEVRAAEPRNGTAEVCLARPIPKDPSRPVPKDPSEGPVRGWPEGPKCRKATWGSAPGGLRVSTPTFVEIDGLDRRLGVALLLLCARIERERGGMHAEGVKGETLRGRGADGRTTAEVRTERHAFRERGDHWG